MPPRIALPPHSGPVWVLFLAAAIAGSIPLSGQELPLQRDYPGSGPYVCPTTPEPTPATPAQRSQAGQLASDADQSTILGDLERAAELLFRATEVDPSSADLAYRHARTLESLERVDGAMLEYCRSMALNAGSSELSDAADRLDTLYELVRERLPERARDAFVAGVEFADSAQYAEADSAFSLAIDDAPDWGAPVYNRAVVREFRGMIAESLDDYRRYLEMAPVAVDPIIVRVSERIGLLEGMVAVRAPSPAGAFVLGMVPGMGHYYSRRPVGGTVILALAGGAAAAGLISKDVTVVCLDPSPPGGVCPPSDIVDEITERPLLVPALGIAAAVTLIGAIEALVKARTRRAEARAITGESNTVGLRVRGPSVRANGRAVDLNLLRINFR